jgi:hypothetical protein
MLSLSQLKVSKKDKRTASVAAHLIGPLSWTHHIHCIQFVRPLQEVHDDACECLSVTCLLSIPRLKPVRCIFAVGVSQLNFNLDCRECLTYSVVHQT